MAKIEEKPQRKAKGRGDGEGSIFTRGEKWIAQVTFVGPDGTRKVVMTYSGSELSSSSRRVCAGVGAVELAGGMLVLGGAATSRI